MKNICKTALIIFLLFFCASDATASAQSSYIKAFQVKKGRSVITVREEDAVTYKLKGKGNFNKWIGYKVDDGNIAKVYVDRKKIHIKALRTGKTKIVVYTKGKTKKKKSISHVISIQVKLPSEDQLHFRSEELLMEHFEKHGKEMGFLSAEEYEKKAASVACAEEALQKQESEDGDFVFYLQSTNELVVVSTDGYIRTYFKPDDGIDYFNRQKSMSAFLL